MNLRNLLIKEEKLIKRIISTIIDFIQNCRSSNNFTNIQIITTSIKFLIETGLYSEFFNDVYVNETNKFYKSLSNEIIKESNIGNYINFVYSSIEIENEIITKYLNEITLKKCLYYLENTLVIEKKDSIVQKIFSEEKPLNNEKQEILFKIFNLFKKVKLEQEIKNTWNDFIFRTTNQIYSTFSKNPIEFFKFLLEFKTNIDNTITNAFNGDEKLKNAAKEGLSKAINNKPSYVADAFSRYIDSVLRAKEEEETVIISRIDEFIQIFRFLDAKDMFENFYINRLALRVIFNESKSKNCERYLVTKLESECGTTFVTKAEEMFNDIEQSGLISQELCGLGWNKLEYSVMLLNSAVWPLPQAVNAIMPREVMDYNVKAMELFLKNTKNKGKVANWHVPYSTATINLTLPKSSIRYQITADGLQALILLHFNKKRSATLNELFKSTQVDKETILRHLHPLIKIQLILHENEEFTLNLNFSSNLKEISLIHHYFEDKHSIIESSDVYIKTWEDRKHVIDAYLMNIMKKHKKLYEHELFKKMEESLPFEYDEAKVIKRLATLKERDFLIQDKDEPTLLQYS